MPPGSGNSTFRFFLRKANSIFQKVFLPRTPKSLKANLLTTDSSYIRRFGRDHPVAYRSQNVLEMHPRHLRTPHDTSGHVRTAPGQLKTPGILDSSGNRISRRCIVFSRASHVTIITGAPFQTMINHRFFYKLLLKLAEALEKSSYPTLELLELFMF